MKTLETMTAKEKNEIINTLRTKANKALKAEKQKKAIYESIDVIVSVSTSQACMIDLCVINKIDFDVIALSIANKYYLNDLTIEQRVDSAINRIKRHCIDNRSSACIANRSKKKVASVIETK